MNEKIFVGIFSLIAGIYGFISWYSYKEKDIKEDEVIIPAKRRNYIPKKSRKQQSLFTGVVLSILGLYILLSELFK